MQLLRSTGVFSVTLALVLLITSPAVADPATAAGKDGRETRKARSTLAPPTRAKPVKPRVRKSGKSSKPTAAERLREDLKRVLRGRNLLRGTTAVLAVEADTGKVLFAANEGKKLNPASNVKLFSTAAVLDILGDDYVYRTKLIGPPQSELGVVSGGVYMLGSGDPTFLSEEIEELVAHTVARGVTKIDGDVSISEDRFRDNLAVPRIRIDAVGARRPGRKPSVTYEPQSDFVELIVKARTSRSRRARLVTTSKLVEKDGKKKWVVTVKGSVRARTKRSIRVGAPLRSTFTANVLRSALIDAGIEVTGSIRLEEFDTFSERVKASGTLPFELAEHKSAPMSELVRLVNKYSINHLADRLVMTAAAQEGDGRLDMGAAVETMNSFMERVGIDPDKTRLDTGSGLSYKTKLTAEQIVAVLRAGAGFVPGSRGNPDSFVDSLAVGGVDGTLRRRLKRSPAKGKVIGKTGTLTSCLALSGFVMTDEGKPIAFAIVTNGNRRRDRRLVRSEHEELIEAIHRYAKRVH